MDEELWQKICQEIKIGTRVKIINCTLAAYDAQKLIGKIGTVTQEPELLPYLISQTLYGLAIKWDSGGTFTQGIYLDTDWLWLTRKDFEIIG